MKAVILAAGEGTRLSPFTYSCPKPLIPIGGKPILEHLLIALKAAGLIEAFIVLHHKAKLIQKYFGDGTKLGLNIKYIIQPKMKGTADAISMAEKYVEDDFLTVYGDLLTTSNTFEKVVRAHKKNENVATLSVLMMKHPEWYGVVQVEDSFVTNILEKPKLETNSNQLVNAGVYIFSTEIFDAIKETENSIRGEKEITDSIRLLINKKKPVIAVQISGKEWLDIGRPWELLEANSRILNQMKNQVEGLIEKGAHLLDTVFIAKGTRIRSGTYIEGPVFIDEGSDIGPNCYIRPYTTVGKNVRIGSSCEVKNSIIMDDTHIGHLTYIGDSVIGKKCNFGAGTITANLRFDSNTIKMSIKGELLDSERVKLGAFIGDNVKTGIGSLLMPGVKIGCNSWIGPNLTVYQDVQPNVILKIKQIVEEKRFFFTEKL